MGQPNFCCDKLVLNHTYPAGMRRLLKQPPCNQSLTEIENKMITGKLKEIDKTHLFNPVIKMAIKDIMANMDSALSGCSRREIMGEDLYWYSKNCGNCKCRETVPEFHEQFIDIELVLKGRETIGYSENNQYDTITDDHILDQDVAYVDGVPDEKYLSLEEGDFAIFFPGDVHRACYKPDGERIYKAVIRINKALL